MKKPLKFYVLTALLLAAVGFSPEQSASGNGTGQADCLKSCESIYRRCMVYAKSDGQKQSCATQKTACAARCQGKP